jgi:hypothetical protein
MSNRSIRQVLVVAFGVSLSSLAMARQPPSLVAQQRADATATQSGGGYRDMNLRFGNVAQRAPTTFLVSGGYRDMHHRFQSSTDVRDVASAQSSQGVR